MTSIKQYITHGILLKDPAAARKNRTRAALYVMIRDNLYRTMGDWPFLKCVLEKDGEYILWEMHEEICRAHIAVSVLVRKVMRMATSGPWWRIQRRDGSGLSQMPKSTTMNIMFHKMNTTVYRPLYLLPNGGWIWLVHSWNQREEKSI